MSDVRIERVESVALESPLADPFGYAQEWVETRSALLVRIEASDGTVGWGECWGPIAGNREIVDDLLGERLIGADPMRVERLSESLTRRGRAAFQTFAPLSAISGLDVALWDLKGKLLGEPLSSLLGGRRRDCVRAYATGHYFRRGLDLEAQYDAIVEEATRNAERFGAVKIKLGLGLLGHGPDEDVELARRVRAAIGEESTLMADANYAYTPSTARRVGRELSELDAYWFEEPVPPEAIDGYAHLRDVLSVDVAGGECHAPSEFDRLFEVGGLDVAQPDLCNVGGITAARDVARIAREHAVQVVPHVWGTPVAIAASLQFIATLPGRPWLEFDQSPNPLRTEVATESFEPDGWGRVSIPDEPGLGVTLDEEYLRENELDR